MLTRRRLEPRDRALCTEIVYGTLRRQQLLDRTLAPFCRQPLAKLEVVVRVTLRMAAYQSAFLGSVPPHAAVHRSVEALKRIRPRATGLANAVLRAWLRAGGELHPGEGSLADRFDLPEWLASRWASRGDAGARWLEATLLPPQSWLRASLEKATPEEVVGHLVAHGAEAEVGARVPGSVRVLDANRAAIVEVVGAGLAVPRSEAAQIVTALLSATESTTLDACSGRGGKARQLAESGALVVAVDNHAGRLADSRRLAGTTGAGRLAWVRADLQDGLPLGRQFDHILVDVPCSGLGTIRRHPEIKWQSSLEDLQRLAASQRRILDTCLAALAPDGHLLYITCSTEAEENEDVVNAALEATAEIVRLPFTAAADGCAVDALGDLRTYPEDANLDGFYVARLTRLPA